MKCRLLVLSLLATLPLMAGGQDQKKADAKARARPSFEAFTDPDQAGPDYQIQGEYVTEDTARRRYGIQAIAEGDGKFKMRALRGGLPGDGWDGWTQYQFTGKTTDGKVTFEGDVASGVIGGGTVTATLRDSGEVVKFKRIVRRSATEGLKPPPGAVVLFDGSSADAWDKGKVENRLLSTMVPGGINSKRAFGDCTVHVEFRTPFMPRAAGQERGNSGVYLQGRYEVQVLDSFGLAGKNNECGGIYELSDPIVNMCYPPLQWQTYDIEYVAAKFDPAGKKVNDAVITVKHNGVLVQDHVALKRDTRAAPVKEGPDKGPLYLQNHGNPVHYRNVWVVEKQ
jgi:hypothetical protein